MCGAIPSCLAVEWEVSTWKMGRKLSSGESETHSDADQSDLGIINQAINHLLSVHRWMEEHTSLYRRFFSLVIHIPESSNCTCGWLNPSFFSLGNQQQKAVGPQGTGVKAVKIMNICVIDLSAAGIEREAPEVNDLQVIREFSRTRSRSCWAWPCWPTAVSYS